MNEQTSETPRIRASGWRGDNVRMGDPNTRHGGFVLWPRAPPGLGWIRRPPCRAVMAECAPRQDARRRRARPMPDVVFVVPFALDNTMRFVRTVAEVPGVRLGVI